MWKFRHGLSRGDLSMPRSGCRGMSQGQFRRDRGRSEADGPDGRRSLAQPSSKRVPAALWLDPGVYLGGRVKHFGAHRVGDDGLRCGAGGDSSRSGACESPAGALACSTVRQMTDAGRRDHRSDRPQAPPLGRRRQAQLATPLRSRSDVRP